MKVDKVVLIKQRPIFFCHIPKTGGTSLRAAISQNFRPNEKMPGPGLMKEYGGHYPPVSRIKREMDARASDIRLMIGHYHWSARQLMTNPITMVVLREPVAQLISHMRHFISAGHLTVEGCLAAIDRGKMPVQSNIITRYLGGDIFASDLPIDRQHGRYMNGPTDNRAMEEAKRAIRSADLLGYTEDLGAFTRAVTQELGISVPVLELNQAKADQMTLSEAQMDTIRSSLALDIELYRYARDIRPPQHGLSASERTS